MRQVILFTYSIVLLPRIKSVPSGKQFHCAHKTIEHSKVNSQVVFMRNTYFSAVCHMILEDLECQSLPEVM